MCSIAAVGIGMTLASTAVSAYGAYNQGQAQSAQLEYQQKVAERNALQAQYQADYERNRAGEEADQHRRKVAQMKGAQRAALAASGVDLGDTDSSAMSLLGDTAQYGEYDAQKILHQGELTAWGYGNQASNEYANAAMYGAGAKQSRNAAWLNAGASLLSGGSQVAGQWYNYSKQS